MDNNQDKNKIDWGKEMVGATLPTAENALELYKQNLRSKVIDDIMENIQKNGDALTNFSNYKKTLTSTMKDYGLFQKVFQKPGNLMKVFGQGVGIFDCLFLGFDLLEVWNNDDSISNKCYESEKKISGALGGVIAGGFAGAKLGSIFGPLGTLVGTVAGSIIGGF